jgi:hypothetical protein
MIAGRQMPREKKILDGPYLRHLILLKIKA